MGFDSKKLLKTLTAGRGAILVPHIEAYQARGKFPPEWHITISNTKADDGFFHPSSHCLLSPLALYNDRMGFGKHEAISPTLRRTFDCGHMWHGYLQNILVDIGLVTQENVERHIVKEIVTGNGMAIGSGTGDLVDVTIPGHGQWLVDLKTMNKPEFEAGATQHTLEKWTAQVNCYGDWFGFEKMMVLAICKDSPHNMREYTILRDDALLAGIYDKWTYVASCMDRGEAPDG